MCSGLNNCGAAVLLQRIQSIPDSVISREDACFDLLFKRIVPILIFRVQSDLTSRLSLPEIYGRTEPLATETHSTENVLFTVHLNTSSLTCSRLVSYIREASRNSTQLKRQELSIKAASINTISRVDIATRRSCSRTDRNFLILLVLFRCRHKYP